VKNWIKIFLIVEIQIVLILVVVVITKTDNLENKLYNTNMFVHEALISKQIQNINTINDNDIVIGDANACVTMFLYSRFDCPACSDFFTENYKLLKSEFIDNGSLKLVVRYLVHPSKKNTLFVSKYSYYANNLGLFDTYIKEAHNQFPKLDTISIYNFIQNITVDQDSLRIFKNDKTIDQRLTEAATEIRNAEILSTPTMYIDDQRIVGNRNYHYLKNVIMTELSNTPCR